MDVCCGEAQHPKPGVDDQVLAAVVFDKSIAMVGAVEFNDQPRGWVIQVGPANEATFCITEVGLNLWMRQAGLNQEPPEPGLHWRFRGRRQQGERSQPRLCNQQQSIGETGADGCVDCDECFYGGKVKA
jgi:hypothetical protein